MHFLSILDHLQAIHFFEPLSYRGEGGKPDHSGSTTKKIFIYVCLPFMGGNLFIDL